jgi:acetyl esterase/lipase
MKSVAIFFFLLTHFAVAQTSVPASLAPPPPLATVDVWPEGKMPGSGAKEPEAEVPAKADGFHRITNISRPTLTVFPAPAKDAPAFIICPGGGYGYVVYDKEGTEIAAWLNSAGFSALVLKYRTPHNREGALQDIQRALSVARVHAAEWHLDPKRLGVIGFSAGGNLAAKASAPVEARSYPPIDATDQQSCRPDFAVLVYPAYLDDKNGHVAADLSLKANIPPTLIVHTEDDKTHVVGSKVYDAALTDGKLAHEFKLYSTGGHVWPDDALAWLHKIGVR